MSTWQSLAPGEGSQEDQQIVQGMLAATHPGQAYEYGHYVERNDDGVWTPLIYGEMSFEEAYASHRHYLAQNVLDVFRHSTVVRRAVGPWEMWA